MPATHTLTLIVYAILATGLALCIGFLIMRWLLSPTDDERLAEARALCAENEAIRREQMLDEDRARDLEAEFGAPVGSWPKSVHEGRFPLPPEPPSEFPRLRIVRGHDYN